MRLAHLGCLRDVSGSALLSWQDVRHDEDPAFAVVIDHICPCGPCQSVEPAGVFLHHTASKVNREGGCHSRATAVAIGSSDSCLQE